MANTLEQLVNYAKQYGFVFQGSEIYGGLANTWDYGPLGVELKNNIKKAWWDQFVRTNPYNVGLDTAIILNPETWVASGHVGGFQDPLMDCRNCKTRHRADKLIEAFSKGAVDADGWTHPQMMEYIVQNEIKCPNCGSKNFTDIREFNLMFKTFQGVVEDAKSAIYLRPETAQGIFLNFKNVQRTTRKKFRSASVRSANRSATKSPRGTSFSGPANSNKWNSSSFANPAPKWNGSSTGRRFRNSFSSRSA